MAYTVRTIILQNYFSPANKLAQQRRSGGDMRDMVSAMKQTELANNTLEKELNTFKEKGYHIVSIIPHPIDTENPHDLLITIILEEHS